ncbi:hypothetical protein SAMN04489712_1372 [Thermomonospora echinospora]|uniref:Uncharacterized protein n=1 Tax=Thermomonospora echinospora TaxID=1992 RepID=A0A1H6E879_9ACTN|nr:hypothetical protein [Thermomonospora echinospora]SEG93065.1 hypothetical protein SAMN04489712_1372 [Thermomonospora echinospora]
MTTSSIPRPKSGDDRRPIRSTSLRALAVAAHLERGLAAEGPPGRDEPSVECTESETA